MEQTLRNLNEKIKTITKPNSKIYSDPLARQLMWSRNIACFYIFSSFAILIGIFTVICNVTLPLKLIFLFFNICVFSSFLILCRSYSWAFNLAFMAIIVTYGYKCFDIVPEAPYTFTGYIFLNTMTMIVMSRDVKLTVGTAGLFLWVLLTKFREKLAILIREEDPEIFVDQYLRFIIFAFILMLFASIGFVTTLEKRSAELLRTKSALENALEQQRTFIFSFSHELRNPINSLLGNLQLVLQGGEVLSAKATEMLNIAKVCGEILLHNINNVLDIGKHDIGKLEVSPILTQINEIFQRTWSIYSELLRQKRLKGQLKIEKHIPTQVKIDSHKVNQILLNLIGNAIKFTEKGSVKVSVNWLQYTGVTEKCFEPIPYDDVDEGLFEKEDNLSTISISQYEPGFHGRQASNTEITDPYQYRQDSKGILKIVVKDTGSGMKKEALDKLFQKFTQVSENISQRNIGTGLGLFITKEICLAMNGEIRVYSKLGVGSTFVVCIPTTTVPSGNIQRANSEVIIHQLTQRHLKALVADDSPFNVNLVCHYFSQFEASVKAVAYNGYDILMKYKEKLSSGDEIDVVILDVDMPRMDGRQVCDGIRQYEKENRLRPVVIILISGNYDKEQVEEYVNPEQGHRADCFLRKPVSFSEFHRAVYDLVVTP